MDKHTYMGMLIDFYGKLLTQKQYEILDLYYYNDYSLAEISENLGITRQGVHDSLRRSQKTLLEYEDKLKLIERFTIQNNNNIKILSKIKDIFDNHIEDKDIQNELNLLIKDFEKLIEYSNE